MKGDIFMQKRSGFAGWLVSRFTGSDWVHCGIDMGDGNVVHVDLYGKHFTPYKQWHRSIRLTVTEPMTAQQRETVRLNAIILPVWGYDIWSAVKSIFWKSKNDNRETGKFYQCAEFVCKIYRISTGLDLMPGRADDAVQPQDFLTSPFLERL